ncbi:hypothetical protein LCGC14_1820800 [marine sediment metagenome]|uniref:Uncharacterized protein n=1 Tax=marine sediment metagenome TaxID=412755 RepID=A0A0F9GJ66_9ZZZZ
MELSNENKKIIYDEIKFVVDILKENEDIDEILYFLSAIHPMIKRIFNIEFNKHLVFMNFVLGNCFGAIMTAVNIVKQEKQPVIINLDFFHKYYKLLEELAEAFIEDKLVYEILEKLSLLIYSISGNGYYLQQKGVKVIDF